MQKERYDKQEDRANDIKKHDNPRHMGKFGNDKRELEAKEKQNEQKEIEQG
jgi:hypothetical protein